MANHTRTLDLSDDDPSPPARAAQGHSYLLAIGIDRYQDENIPQLYNAVRDVRDFVALMQKKYGFSGENATVITLYDEAATIENIQEKLEDLAERITPNDNCILYFSGHGHYKKTLGEGYWITADAKGTTVLKEITNFTFQKKGDVYIIDRTTTLKAQKETVVFKDVKDGFFAIRVARELEHPSDKADSFVDASGIVTKVDKLDNTYITGKYRSSEGVEGEDVWSKRGRWMNLTGNIKGEDISVCIIDHPKNVNYPTYWHARGYGLFAANPLGEKVFSNGKKELNLTLAPKKSVTFRYRTVIASSKLTDAEINALADEYK